MDLDLEALESFRRWLISRRGLSETTALANMFHVRAIVQRESLDLADYSARSRKNKKAAWAHWIDWHTERGHPAPQSLRNAPHSTERLRQAVSLTESDWRKLLSAYDPRDRRDQVLEVLTLTGLRVGDILRTDHASWITLDLQHPTLHIVQKKQKVREYMIQPAQLDAVLRLRQGVLDSRSINTAQYVSKGSADTSTRGPAYRSLMYRLKQLGKNLSIGGRIYTHRFRRTIAVFIANAGGSDEEVRDALGQQSTVSARIYRDEVRTERALSKLGGILDRVKGEEE